MKRIQMYYSIDRQNPVLGMQISTNRNSYLSFRVKRTNWLLLVPLQIGLDISILKFSVGVELNLGKFRTMKAGK